MLARICCFLLFAASFPLAGLAAESLAVMPGKFTLQSTQSTQRLLVERVRDGRHVGQITSDVSWKSSNPKVVVIKNNIAKPVGNGTATITAQSGNQTATASVTVRGINKPHRWEFRRHVLPVLAKSGCNNGACHGALAGKGGFKLSLHGYDPLADHWAITRQARGRRIEPSDPGRSLFLAKPSGAIRHKGGLRFETDSPEYRILSEWIIAGARPPTEDDPQLTAVEVFPKRVTLRPKDTQQLIVVARYSDGRQEDVTRWAKFNAANAKVAEVGSDGKVSVVGHGQGAVVVWFSSRIVLSRITSPYPHTIDPAVYEKAPRRNFIDKLVLAKLANLNLAPSPRCTDEQFIRRASLDTIGTLPTADEVRSFLDDPAKDKRDRLIESLLGRKEFVDYWTFRWADLLLVNGRRLRPDAVKAYYQWIRSQVEGNTPWDEMVRSIITAKGSSIENGATNFYALHQSPEEMSENVSQAFLGLSIGCAKCHNHPLEKWTNDQYYAMANMFARVRSKGWGGDGRSGDGRRTLYVALEGDLIQPRTGKAQPPAPLDAPPLPTDDPSDRRVVLAQWVTSPENPYFSRAIVNRIWANFFGIGLVNSVDDLRVSNPASNEALLDASAAYLVKNKFDLKTLMRAILQSETYQRSSQSLPENQDEQRFFSRYYPRRLMAEVLLDAIAQVTEVPSEFKQIGYDGNDFVDTKEYPRGTRAIQLYDSAVVSQFLKTFGRNDRDITCECERSNTPSMIQVLHINNGSTINGRLKHKESCVAKALAAKTSDAALLEDAYFRTLSRRPTAKERESLLKIMAEAKGEERRVVIEDLYWAIMSSREFLFNH
ncbi:MAG: DUF1553 domain-containing protein [Planctomycetes bacterium]|nr:DUF1553 domain-containing protein [Planctomycetota bacterium]